MEGDRCTAWHLAGDVGPDVRCTLTEGHDGRHIVAGYWAVWWADDSLDQRRRPT